MPRSLGVHTYLSVVINLILYTYQSSEFILTFVPKVTFN